MPEIALTSVRIRTRDMERSREFYQAVGLALSPIVSLRTGYRFCSCQLGEVLFWIYELSVHEAASADTQLQFQVTSLEISIQSLQKSGFSPEMTTGGGSAPGRALFVDPDGHHVELQEAR